MLHGFSELQDCVELCLQFNLLVLSRLEGCVGIVIDYNQFLVYMFGCKELREIVLRRENEKHKTENEKIQRHKIFYMENPKGKNHRGQQTLRNRITIIERKYNSENLKATTYEFSFVRSTATELVLSLSLSHSQV